MFYEKLAKFLKFPNKLTETMFKMREKHGDIIELQNILFDESVSEKELEEKAKETAKSLGEHEYTFALYLLFISAKKMHENYAKKGIDEQIFWDTIYDINYKLNECKEVHDIGGIFVLGWFANFYRLIRFTLGRMQYDLWTYFLKKPYQSHGFNIGPKHKALSCHIPSSGAPFNKAARLESYRKAYEFTAKIEGFRPLVIICNTWLFYKEHEDFLPKNSNILNFMQDFDITHSEDVEGFPDAWRIFGKAHKLPPKEWPTETSMQRAFANRINAGKPVGVGQGVLIFDGEKIINK